MKVLVKSKMFWELLQDSNKCIHKNMCTQGNCKHIRMSYEMIKGTMVLRWWKMLQNCEGTLQIHNSNKPQSIETEPLANALKFLFGRWRQICINYNFCKHFALGGLRLPFQCLEFTDWNQVAVFKNQLKCLFSNIETLLFDSKNCSMLLEP